MQMYTFLNNKKGLEYKFLFSADNHVLQKHQKNLAAVEAEGSFDYYEINNLRSYACFFLRYTEYAMLKASTNATGVSRGIPSGVSHLL